MGLTCFKLALSIGADCQIFTQLSQVGMSKENNRV